MSLPVVGSRWVHVTGVAGTVIRSDEDGIDLRLDEPLATAPFSFIYGAFPPDLSHYWQPETIPTEAGDQYLII